MLPRVTRRASFTSGFRPSSAPDAPPFNRRDPSGAPNGWTLRTPKRSTTLLPSRLGASVPAGPRGARALGGFPPRTPAGPLPAPVPRALAHLHAEGCHPAPGLGCALPPGSLGAPERRSAGAAAPDSGPLPGGGAGRREGRAELLPPGGWSGRAPPRAPRLGLR
eukprot:bmy_14901T0